MFDDPITDRVIDRYLKSLAEDIDTLVLGCTHYPLAREAIARVAGAKIHLVDSAENCALAVKICSGAAAAAPAEHSAGLMLP